MYQWAITIGLLLASIVNNATQHRDNHSSYRIPIAMQFVWAVVLASGMSYLPEVFPNLSRPTPQTYSNSY
jgi:SP family sugar:H+ symporter-like MFS transporter